MQGGESSLNQSKGGFCCCREFVLNLATGGSLVSNWVQIDYSQAVHQGEKESKTLADIAQHRS